LRRFANANPQLLSSIDSWVYLVERSNWKTPQDIKRDFGSASILKNSRVVFNLHGNTIRLVAAVLYEARVLLVKFIGFHREYDAIDAQTVEQKEWRN